MCGASAGISRWTFFYQGDNIIVWYEDMDESDVSAPVSTLDYGNPDDVKRSVLNEYHLKIIIFATHLKIRI